MTTLTTVSFLRPDDVMVVDRVRSEGVDDGHRTGGPVPVYVLTRHSHVHQADINGRGEWLVFWTGEKDAEHSPPWTIHASAHPSADAARAKVAFLIGAGCSDARCVKPPDATLFADAIGNGKWVATREEAEKMMRHGFARLR